MIIGITGYNGAGKTTVVEYLEKKGFYTTSLSDILREMLRKEGKEITRENLIKKGNELREKNGSGILGEIALQKISDDVPSVVESIRHPGEVEALRERHDFVLVFVDAPLETRFERMIERKKEGEHSYERILAFEKEEMENEEQFKEQLSRVAKMANIVLVNDREKEQLYKKIDKMVTDLTKKYGSVRPSWDNYMMDLAKSVAKRSTCMKQKIGAVIAQDKQIISIGYNGTPKGILNCNEGGCPSCATVFNPEEKEELCLCNHSEENVIIQAAYYGSSVKDAALYTTASPCASCVKMIINAGIKEVIFNGEFPLEDRAYALLQEAHIVVKPKKGE